MNSPVRTGRGAPRGPRIFIVGAGIPPPTGGVTVHVERLALLLRDHGYAVEVFDTTGVRDRAKELIASIRVWHGSVLYVAFVLLWRLIVARPAILHWHVGGLWRASKLLRVMAGVSGIVPTVLTIHSGSFASRLESSSAGFRAVVARLCARCVAIVAVNASIAEAIRLLGVRPKAGLHIIPAFLHASRAVASRPAQPGPTLKAIACGYGTALYGWHVLVPALADERIAEWHWAIYTGWDAEYMTGVLQAAEQTAPGKMTLHRELGAADFQRLLASCDLFVRPTETDGDSVALREAMAAGLMVVASDAVARPTGCEIFRTGDAAHLRQRLRAVRKPERANRIEDYSRPLLELYRSIAGVPQACTLALTQPETGA